jgi:predicted transcriptional regulator
MSWKRGAYPEFTVEDAVAALFILKKPIGRKALAEMLDLGEGSIRTLLRKLNGLELIQSAQRGHSLSERGLELVKKLSEEFSEVQNVGKIEGLPAYALVVRKPGEFKSIELRDEAIRFLAKGAMILTVKNGAPAFPEDGRPLRETMPELADRLETLLEFSDGDVIVVTWAENPAAAMKSAYHVAITLKGDSLPEDLLRIMR